MSAFVTMSGNKMCKVYPGCCSHVGMAFSQITLYTSYYYSLCSYKMAWLWKHCSGTLYSLCWMTVYISSKLNVWMYFDSSHLYLLYFFL